MRILNITINHNRIYFYCLILTVICFPVSKFALSISMICLIANWLLEADFKRKFNDLLYNKSILIFLGVFLVHVIWLINTQNFKYAFHDLGNKVILILYPIIIGTSEKLSSHQIKKILLWFSLTVIVSTLISTSILVGLIDYPVKNIRDISPFMSHIRLSLLINMSIYSLGYLFFSSKFKMKSIRILLYIVSIIWLIVFLYLLKSLTGIIIFLVILFLTLGFISFKIKAIVYRLFLQMSLIAIFLFIAFFLSHSINKFYNKEIIDFNNLDTHTVSGNLYQHYIGNNQIENGNYVWINICDKELEKEWERVSSTSYKGLDSKKQRFSTTLKRYLASKGLRKDSVGVSKLSKQDIINIESGMANYIYENKYAIYPRIYKAIWEIDVYRKGTNPAGNSITQRIEFFKAAKGIIQDKFWFGVGTGDVQDAFNNQYDLNESKLPEKKRLWAHNQYITFLLTFGIVGFIVLIFSMIYPVLKYNAFNNYYFIIFFTIVLLSFINEDTLETQIGVTFFSYFYSLFLFGNKMIFKKGEDYVQ